MLVYSKTKQEFMSDLVDDRIVEEVDRKVLQKLGRHTPESEKRAWQNSLQAMYKVLNVSDIPSDVGIAIEYNIPQTAKRIDLLLSGYDEDKNPNAIIVELKQWETINKVDTADALVETFINKGIHKVVHPSYQAYSYATLLNDFNQTVEDMKVDLKPCAYLHNYQRQYNDPIDDAIYEEYTRQAPVFTKGQATILADYLNTYLRYGDDRQVITAIESGKLRPSKRLQDEISAMIDGNNSFVLIDDQKVAFERILELVKESIRTQEKRTIIIEGGPGTGKSVIAINLLCQLIRKGLNSRYVTKTDAPRSVYKRKLKGKRHSMSANNLFIGSGCFNTPSHNEYDVLIVDESHRLVKKGMYVKEGNQIREIIHNSLVSVFFIDENQQVKFEDFGTIEEIETQAHAEHSQVERLELVSQFRCNGSDGYLAWLDNTLQIRDTANFSLEGIDYDIQILDSPQEVLKKLVEKNSVGASAKLTAGYCWEWDKGGKSNPDVKDIQIGDFAISWNLSSAEPFVLRNNVEEDCGCIHTVQGLEYDYAGVIIGNDMICRDGKVYTDPDKRAKSDKSLAGWKKAFKLDPDGTMKRVDQIIKNTYRTLMTRGMKGCYVYCMDKELSGYLKSKLGTETSGNTVFEESLTKE